jgi:hypothetical protein
MVRELQAKYVCSNYSLEFMTEKTLEYDCFGLSVVIRRSFPTEYSMVPRVLHLQLKSRALKKIRFYEVLLGLEEAISCWQLF